MTTVPTTPPFLSQPSPTPIAPAMFSTATGTHLLLMENTPPPSPRHRLRLSVETSLTNYSRPLHVQVRLARPQIRPRPLLQVAAAEAASRERLAILVILALFKLLRLVVQHHQGPQTAQAQRGQRELPELPRRRASTAPDAVPDARQLRGLGRVHARDGVPVVDKGR